MLLPRSFIAAVTLLTTAFAEEPFAFDRTPGRLPKDVVPHAYRIHIEPSIEAASLEGSETIDIEVRQPTRAIVLHSLGLEITSATLRTPEPLALSAQLDPQKQTLTFSLSRELAPGRYRLEIAFRGKLDEKPVGLYLTRYQSGTEQKRALATQMEPSDARRMFPCWDEPAFRATFQLNAVVPEKLTAVSNMPAISEEKSAGGRKEIAFAPTPVMPSYLVAFCAGELEELKDEVDGVQLRIFTTEGKREQARYAMEVTKKVLPFYNEYFGQKYPLPKLDQIAFASTGASGMENWGAIVYNDTALLYDPAKSSQWTKERVFSVVAHEIAHQWFGDLVTMGWWDNLWLNEGFASWMENKATDHFNPEWQTMLRSAAEKEYAMALDARATTHPIQQAVRDESEASDAFDEITYQKGQAFLQMLESYLGTETFRDGIRRYMARHAFGNTTTADLWKALGESSGKDVAEFAKGWTEQPGFPLVRVEISKDRGLGRALLQQERFTINQPKSEPLSWEISLVFSSFGNASDRQVILLRKTDGERARPFVVDRLPVPAVFNSEGVGYFRVSYDFASLTELTSIAESLAPADRLTLLNDTWALAQAGRAEVTQYLNLIAKVATEEKAFPIWDQIIGALEFADSLHRATPQREEFRRWARALLRPQFIRLGWDAKAGESALDGMLRSRVLWALGVWGDEAVQNEARVRFTQFLATPESLPGDLRRTVFWLVGRSADAATYEDLHALAKREVSFEQKRNLYGALAQAQTPELVDRTLAIALSDELPPNDATRLVQRVGSDGEQTERAWDFAQKHRDTLLAKLSAIEANDYIPNLLHPFNDAARAGELETFAKQYLRPEAGSSVAKAADAIRFKAEFKSRLVPQVAAWLHARGD